MKRAIYKLVLFLSPFILISLFEFFVDPYNLFNISHLITNEVKIKCLNRTRATSPRGNILWKTIEFERNPTPNLILGDSRLVDVSTTCIEKRIGGKVTNIAVPAGNYRTIIDLFWMTAKKIKLENVIIETGFTQYHALRNFDLYGPARKIIDKPINFFFNWTYLKDSFSVLYYSITNDIQSYKDYEDNWEFADKAMSNLFSNYFYPKESYKELVKISEFCKKEKINIIYVIAPDYYELHNIIKSFNLENEYNRFKADIGALGTTIDLDNGEPFSFNKDNYSDYFHIKANIADTLVSMIFQSPLLTKDFPNK